MHFRWTFTQQEVVTDSFHISVGRNIEVGGIYWDINATGWVSAILPRCYWLETAKSLGCWTDFQCFGCEAEFQHWFLRVLSLCDILLFNWWFFILTGRLTSFFEIPQNVVWFNDILPQKGPSLDIRSIAPPTSKRSSVLMKFEESSLYDHFWQRNRRT